MDLAPIGAHCYSCNTLDLLPLTCPYCLNVFCKLHSSIANHPCHTSASTFNSNSSSSSAGGPSSSRGERCELAGCEGKRMRTWVLSEGSTAEGSSGNVPGEEVKCEQCGGGFCLSHRTPTSHACKPPPMSLTPHQLLTKSLISSHFQPTPPMASSTPSLPPAPQKKRKKALSPAIELLRIQQGAVPGRGEVRERKDRWHLRVGVDLEGRVVGREDVGQAEEEGTGKEGEKGVYYRRDLTVAQVLRSILTSKKIEYNPIAGDPSSLLHLVAFLPTSGFSNGLPSPSLLDRTKRIDQCGMLDGGRVWVVRGQGVWTRS